MANAVAVIIYRQNKILLQKRNSYAKKNPGLWGFFGGSLKNNEDVLQGLKREVFEELTYQLTNPELIYEINLPTDGKKIFFAEYYDDQQSMTLNEGEDMKWFTIEELGNIDIAPHHQAALSHFFAKKSPHGVHESD